VCTPSFIHSQVAVNVAETQNQCLFYMKIDNQNTTVSILLQLHYLLLNIMAFTEKYVEQSYLLRSRMVADQCFAIPVQSF
jgi:hypothetical protein